MLSLVDIGRMHHANDGRIIYVSRKDAYKHEFISEVGVTQKRTIEPQGESIRRSSADTAYSLLREGLLKFQFLPSQRLNEVTLAAEFNVSRTPLREALNRLSAEGMLEDMGRGFCVPALHLPTVQNLFEARLELECGIVRLACERATESSLAELSDFLSESEKESPDASVDRLIQLDIGFHDRLATLSENVILQQLLRNLNDRIHLVRWIAMDGRRSQTQAQHREIVNRLQAKDQDGAIKAVRNHIMHRKEEILAAIKAAYGYVYTLTPK